MKEKFALEMVMMVKVKMHRKCAGINDDIVLPKEYEHMAICFRCGELGLVYAYELETIADLPPLKIEGEVPESIPVASVAMYDGKHTDKPNPAAIREAEESGISIPSEEFKKEHYEVKSIPEDKIDIDSEFDTEGKEVVITGSDIVIEEPVVEKSAAEILKELRATADTKIPEEEALELAAEMEANASDPSFPYEPPVEKSPLEIKIEKAKAKLAKLEAELEK